MAIELKKIDTHGLKITGLKKASGETENHGAYSGKYNEIFYNTNTGEVWTEFQYSLGSNSWTVYDDPAIIRIGETSSHLTMQQIADAVHEAVCTKNLEN